MGADYVEHIVELCRRVKDWMSLREDLISLYASLLCGVSYFGIKEERGQREEKEGGREEERKQRQI